MNFHRGAPKPPALPAEKACCHRQEMEKSRNPSGISYEQFQKLLAELGLDKAKGGIITCAAELAYEIP